MQINCKPPLACKALGIIIVLLNKFVEIFTTWTSAKTNVRFFGSMTCFGGQCFTLTAAGFSWHKNGGPGFVLSVTDMRKYWDADVGDQQQKSQM